MAEIPPKRRPAQRAPQAAPGRRPAVARGPVRQAPPRPRPQGGNGPKTRVKPRPARRTARRPAGRPTRRAPPPQQKKSTLWIWITAAAALVVLIGGAIVVAVNLGPEDTKPVVERPDQPPKHGPDPEPPKSPDILELAEGPVTEGTVRLLLARADELENEGKLKRARSGLQKFRDRDEVQSLAPRSSLKRKVIERIGDLTDAIQKLSAEQQGLVNLYIDRLWTALADWDLAEAERILAEAEEKIADDSEFDEPRSKLEAMADANKKLGPLEARGGRLSSGELSAVKGFVDSSFPEIVRRAEKIYVAHVAPPLLAEGKRLLDERIETAKRNYARAKGKKVPEGGGSAEGTTIDFFRRPRWGTALDPVMENLPDDLQVVRERYLRTYRKLRGRADQLSSAEGRDLDEFAEMLAPFPQVHYYRALGAFIKEDYRTAEKAAKLATDLEPRYGEAWVLRARVATEWSQFATAEGHLDKAAESLPDLPEIYLNRALIRIYQERKEQAKKELEFALKVAPKNFAITFTVNLLRGAIAGPKFMIATPHQHRTKHYVVYTDISAERAKEIGEMLEAIRPWYGAIVGGQIQQDNAVRVYVFKRREEFAMYGAPSPGVLGWYHPIYREFVFYDMPDDREQFLHIMFHEGFHQYVRVAIPNVPRWLNEALAEYAASARIKDGRVVGEGSIDEFLGKGRMPHASLSGPQEIRENFVDAYYQSPNWGYASGWSLVHCMFRYEGGRYKHHIRGYIAALRKGHTPREAHRKTMPSREDRGALYSGWRRHREQLLEEFGPDAGKKKDEEEGGE